MRLRQFMAAPDEPIPNAPKDWMPPMPTPDTPPAGESDSESDSTGDEVRRWGAMLRFRFTRRNGVGVTFRTYGFRVAVETMLHRYVVILRHIDTIYMHVCPKLPGGRNMSSSSERGNFSFGVVSRSLLAALHRAAAHLLERSVVLPSHDRPVLGCQVAYSCAVLIP